MSIIHNDLNQELGKEFVEKEFAKRKEATPFSKILRNVKTLILLSIYFYVMIIPMIIGILSYENSSTGYWCTPLAILMGLTALFTALYLTPLHDFSIESHISDREVLRIMREDYKKGYFKKNNNKLRNFGIALAVGFLLFLIMKIAVMAWDGVLEPYIGKIGSSIIALVSFALPALVYIIIKALSK